MNNKYKNEGYLKTKTGTNNFKPTMSLLEKIWPDKKVYTGDDVNKLNEGLMENVDVKRLKQTVVEQPIKSQIKSREFNAKSEMIAIKQLYKDLGKAKKSITITV